MNDMNINPENASEPEAETENEENGEFGLDDIERRYFGPDLLETDAQEYVALVTSIEGVTVKSNFDDEVPEGYGLAVMPISKRGDNGNEVIGVCIAAMPDPDTIAAHEKGADFIRDVVQQNMMAKIANSVRPRANGTTAGSMPFSVDSFIEGGRRGGSLKTYTQLASQFVKALREMGLKFMTSSILKQTLQSAAFAESQFSRISQDNWEKVLHGMIAKAKDTGLDPAILEHWLETRDEAEMEVADDLDFSAFDEM